MTHLQRREGSLKLLLITKLRQQRLIPPLYGLVPRVLPSNVRVASRISHVEPRSETVVGDDKEVRGGLTQVLLKKATAQKVRRDLK